MLVRYLIRRNRFDIKIIDTQNFLNKHCNIILTITDNNKSGICDALKTKISSLQTENIELKAKVAQLMGQNKGI